MATSKLKIKSQATVPHAVRTALGLGPGDEIDYRIDDGQAIMTKPPRRNVDEPFKSFDEWDFEADRRAYAKL
jgi:antitoxin PrlF